MRIHSGPDHTRLVLDLSGPTAWSHFTLDGPARVVLDMDAGQLRFDPERLDLAGTPIRRVRAAARENGGLRVVLDLSRALTPKPFDLAPVAPYGYRLVVDLYEEAGERAALRVAPQADARRDIVVAIDPGHGGEDPGALGPNRVREKDVVLAIARRLDALFDGAPGFRGELLRTGDYYVPLRRRTELAREHRADLFISVHADAFKNSRPRGASVFALSPRGATSEMARWLAESENQSDLIGGVGGVSLADKDPVLAEVLLDLSMTGSLSASLDLGERVLASLGGDIRLHSHQVHQAGFAVLKSPDIPSILVETGFISNPQEAVQLADAAYQARLARAIYDGARAHLEELPPPGTLLAWLRDNPDAHTRYTIEKGDTLSAIAQRFGVETGRLRTANGLAGDVIRVGQTLVIPPS
ncbi:MAG TPA: N-acetylmuramoyl-L-alanine amidase [Pseudomonadales bacterium]|nr:N-acetylmuramoyl-L-alanine amidase [Pseudomonadales bacterium]